jgi:hypothetical protein
MLIKYLKSFELRHTQTLQPHHLPLLRPRPLLGVPAALLSKQRSTENTQCVSSNSIKRGWSGEQALENLISSMHAHRLSRSGAEGEF